MAEQVQDLGDGRLEILASVAPWQHVRPMGEDLVATEMVLPENHVLTAVDLGAVIAAGHTCMRVRRKSRGRSSSTEKSSVPSTSATDGGPFGPCSPSARSARARTSATVRSASR